MNVKPGDLAIVISGDAAGIVCEVMHQFFGGVYMGLAWAKHDAMWMCRFPRSFSTPQGYSCFIAVRDCNLRPVSGLPDTEHTDEREPIKELA